MEPTYSYVLSPQIRLHRPNILRKSSELRAHILCRQRPLFKVS